jgi:hypothetical protein
MMRRSGVAIQLRVTCPHCWNRFPPEETLWISQHPDLVGDVRLGPDQQQRFLPTRFTIDGAAIDARGFPCYGLACPKCNLPVPRALFEMPPIFLSILGAPACGKSYFLAAMTWRLRQILPRHFCLALGDADPAMNHILNEYEETQFLNPNQDRLIALRKTEEQGDLYDTVLFGQQTVRYPRPFVLSVTAMAGHPNYAHAAKVSRALCLYDNAGESFLPGSDSAGAPVTRHLASSSALFFLFDPTQDHRFRQACRGKTNDPQMQERSARLDRERAVRQDTVLHEAAQRVRRYAGLGQNAKHARPLIVVATKYDAWSALMGQEPLESPWVPSSKHAWCALDRESIESRSDRLRALLWDLTPEIVAAAEGFAQQVLYMPVSAMGRSPEVDPETGALGIRPRDVNPQGVEVPLLYFLSRWTDGTVAYRKPKSRDPVNGQPATSRPPSEAPSTTVVTNRPRARGPASGGSDAP